MNCIFHLQLALFGYVWQVMEKKVAIMAQKEGWHTHALKEALDNLGYEGVSVNLEACSIEAGSPKYPPKVCLPGFEEKLPQGVFVRGIPKGGLERIVFFLDVLHCIEDLGVCVYNSATMIEKATDKARTSFLLRYFGVPSPAAWAVSDMQQARQLCANMITEGKKIVVKPIFGSMGKGLYLMTKTTPFPDYYRDDTAFYMQEFIPPCGEIYRDFRVLVIGGEAAFTMERLGGDWVSNIAQGGEAVPIVLESLGLRTACRAVRALGLFYAGVDMILDAQGEYVVLEVNGIPAWHGLQSTVATNISDRIVQDFVVKIDEKLIIDN